MLSPHLHSAQGFARLAKSTDDSFSCCQLWERSVIVKFAVDPVKQLGGASGPSLHTELASLAHSTVAGRQQDTCVPAQPLYDLCLHCRARQSGAAPDPLQSCREGKEQSSAADTAELWLWPRGLGADVRVLLWVRALCG